MLPSPLFRINLNKNNVPVTVLIADPQYLTREGLQSSLDKEMDLKVVAVENLYEIDKYIKTNKPDVLILDYLQDGLSPDNKATVQQLVEENQQLLIISSDQNTDRIRTVINTGVKGYLTKNCTREEVLTAIRFITAGNRFFCNKVLDILMNERETGILPLPSTNLSTRELEILKLIATGHTTALIADALHISVHTVNSHRKNILKKLDLKSPTQLVAYAHEAGLVR